MTDRKTAVMSAVGLVLLGASLVLGLSGCSPAAPDGERQSATGTSVSEASESPLMADMRQAAVATKALASAHLAIRTTGQIDSMIGITSADLDVRVNPLTATGMSTYEGTVNVPLRIKDGTVSVRLFDEWTNLGSVSDLVAPGLLNPTDGVAKILSGVADPESQGSEVIGGVSTTRITGTIPPEIAKIMDPAANKSSRSTVWISEDGSHRAVQTLVNLGPGQSVQITLSKWNEPVNTE
jgi:hypothetical protein